MAKKDPSSTGITNAVLLRHMQGMRSSLETRIDGLERRVTHGFTDVHGRLGKLEGRLGNVERDVGHIKVALQRLYTHRINMLGRIERLEETVGIG